MKQQKIKQCKLRQLGPQTIYTIYTSDHPHMKGARGSQDHLIGYRQNLQKLRGTKVRRTKQLSGCKCKNQLMNLASLQKVSCAGFFH